MTYLAQNGLIDIMATFNPKQTKSETMENKVNSLDYKAIHWVRLTLKDEKSLEVVINKLASGKLPSEWGEEEGVERVFILDRSEYITPSENQDKATIKLMDKGLIELWNNEISRSSNVLIDDMTDTFNACIQTACKKNHDYAGKETTDPYKNFRNSAMVGVSVQKGILVRLMDKMSRISNLLDQEAAVKDEAITDTIEDAINYLAILGSTIKNKI